LRSCARGRGPHGLSEAPARTRRPAPVGLEECLIDGQRVAAQAGLLVEHGREEVARRPQLGLRADHRVTLLPGDQPDAAADHEDRHGKNDA
jgi:hypothetical protein